MKINQKCHNYLTTSGLRNIESGGWCKAIPETMDHNGNTMDVTKCHIDEFAICRSAINQDAVPIKSDDKTEFAKNSEKF